MRCAAIVLLSFLAIDAQTPAPAQTPAQAPPATEVYLSALGRDMATRVHGPALNISRSPGYDNQPSFTPDGKSVLFSSNRDGKQTDIYRYEIATKVLTQLTHTPEAEYSPLVTPDGRTFSVIRVEADNTQRLWRFDLNGSNPRLVLDYVKPVGYHVWIDATHLGLYILGGQGQPATLQLADTATGMAEVIATGIGRSIALRPGRQTLTFVSQAPGSHAVIKEFDPKARTVTTIVETLEGSQDFAWDCVYKDCIYMARGPKIFSWNPQSGGWRETGDLSAEGLDKITRIAVNPDIKLGSANRLAFVAEPVVR